MTAGYDYTLYIWPSTVTAIFLLALACYSWQRRKIPGAFPLMTGCLFGAAWAFGSIMEYAAVDVVTKIEWLKIQGIFQLPIVTAITCFFLEYSWPGRWLSRRNLILFSIPCLLALGSVITNDLYHLSWSEFTYDRIVIAVMGPFTWIVMAYAFVGLGLLNLIIFAWLFRRSPQQRWPVVLMLAGQIAGRTVYALDSARVFSSPLHYNVLGMAFEFFIYAIVLYRFRILDPIPMAQRAAIEQLHAGMLVLDFQGKIVSLNPAAERILGLMAKTALRKPARELLTAYPDALKENPVETETRLGSRDFILTISRVNDWRGLEAGQLVLLRDITEQKQIQAQMLEQQRALAALQERERLARELHDGLGQVLGYVKLQAQSIRDRLTQKGITEVDDQLERLIAATQDAHTDVREYILGAQAYEQVGFLPRLQQYLKHFSEVYDLPTGLVELPDWRDDLLEPTVAAQLLRIIQEALTNVRKHARASCVQVILQIEDSRARVTIQDDGMGFNPQHVTVDAGKSYGLRFMLERAVEVGGNIAINSIPGQGTRVVVDLPIKLVGERRL